MAMASAVEEASSAHSAPGEDSCRSPIERAFRVEQPDAHGPLCRDPIDASAQRSGSLVAEGVVSESLGHAASDGELIRAGERRCGPLVVEPGSRDGLGPGSGSQQ